MVSVVDVDFFHHPGSCLKLTTCDFTMSVNGTNVLSLVSSSPSLPVFATFLLSSYLKIFFWILSLSYWLHFHPYPDYLSNECKVTILRLGKILENAKSQCILNKRSWTNSFWCVPIFHLNVDKSTDSFKEVMELIY